MIRKHLLPSRSKWISNPMPGNCGLYLPLWSPDLRGTVFKSLDPYGHSCVATVPTKTGYGDYFDGTDDDIDCGDHTILDLDYPCTISVVFRATSVATASQHLCGRDDNTSRNFSVKLSTDKLLFLIWVGGTTTYDATGYTASANTWYVATCVFEATGQYMYTYVNGSLEVTKDIGSASNHMDNDDVHLSIGERANGDHDMTGDISEVAVWKGRAFSAVEANDYYRSVKSRMLWI